MAPLNLSQRCFCVVSGASRGIGRSFAVELAKKFTQGSHVVLLARNEEQLTGVQGEIEAVTCGRVTVTVQGMDLQRPDGQRLRRVFEEIVNKGQSVPFDLALCIHNVGTVGDIDKFAATESDADKWGEYFQVSIGNSSSRREIRLIDKY